jgi:hypothetical protein
VCCGTKRLVEIRCPGDCVYLASAREHPAAVVRKQQERDVARLLPTIQHLTERQYQLFFLFQTAIARHRPEGFARVADADVADGAAAFASTLETAVRGVIYEHTASSTTAQSLASALSALLTQMREQGARIFDGEAAVVLRAIEQGARTLKGPGEGDTAYLELMARLLAGAGTPEPARPEPAAGGSLILP